MELIPLISVLLSVLCSTLPSVAGEDFKVELSGVTSDRVPSQGLTYCVGKELKPAYKYVSAVVVSAGSRRVERVRVFLASSSGDHAAASACNASLNHAQLVFVWHQGSPTQLLLAKTGSGNSAFPITEQQRYVMLEVTYMPSLPSATPGESLPSVSVNLLLSYLGRPLTSGIATIEANVSPTDAKGRDHIISACQYKKASALQPVAVFWDTSPEVYRVSLHIMDVEKHNAKIAIARKHMGRPLAPSILSAKTDQLLAKDVLAIKCFFNASQSSHAIRCSANMLFETSSTKPVAFFCNATYLNTKKGKSSAAGSTHPPPALDNPLLQLSDAVENAPKEEEQSHHFTQVDWLKESAGLLPAAVGGSSVGPISGVAVDPRQGTVLIVHTADKTKRRSLFDANNMYKFADEGPIRGDAVLELDPNTGKVIRSWGKNFFYLPHGIFVDHLGQVWITDRAKHQVYGFRRGDETPFITLGEEFMPGSSDYQFCKPADVAVSSSSGTIFVADGHCNSRVLKFSASGHLLANWGIEGGGLSAVFHSIALSPDDALVCFAVSTSSAVFCVDQFSGSLMKTFKSARLPVPSDGIAFGSHWSNGHAVLHVIGGGSHGVPVTGVSLDFTSMKVVDTFSPSIAPEALSVAHDIAASTDGLDLYVADLAVGRVLKFTRRRTAGSSSTAAVAAATSSAAAQSSAPHSSHAHSSQARPGTTKASVPHTSAAQATTARKAAASARQETTANGATTNGGQHAASAGSADSAPSGGNHATAAGGSSRAHTNIAAHDSVHSSADSASTHRHATFATGGEPKASMHSDAAAATTTHSQATSQQQPNTDVIKKQNQQDEEKAAASSPTTAAGHKKKQPLSGAETIAIAIVGACIGVIVFAAAARLYISYRKRRKFHRRLFPEEHGNKSSRRVLLEPGAAGYQEDNDAADDSDTETESFGDQRAFRYYWKKVAKQVA